MKKLVLLLVCLVNIFADNFDFVKVKQLIQHEASGEKIYVNYLKKISTSKQHYVSVEFANASIYKFYLLLSINEKKITITKYNFNPNGAYSFSVEYMDNIEFSIENFLNNFIDENKIHFEKKYQNLRQIQFNTKKYSIVFLTKNRLPTSNVYLNKSIYLNKSYIEPVFNKNFELKSFFKYINKITEEDIMSQEFQKFKAKNILSLNKMFTTQIMVSLLEIEKKLKQKKDLKTYNKEFFQNLLPEKPIEKKTLTTYNNIAYYLQKVGANEEAVYLLEKILEKFPKRTVAYYNLGDAYWALGEKKKAKKAYSTYIKMMKAKGKEKQIPKVVKDRAI